MRQLLNFYFISHLEKNPFSQRRETAGFDDNKIKEGGPIDENSDTDDFDEFYNDKSFLNTGMHTGMNNMNAMNND